MLRSAIPLRFSLAWAKNAAGAYIRTVPVTSQIGIQDGAASFNDGFVPDNFTSLAGGGVPPFGQDFNGVLNITTTWDQWYQAGAPIAYDATYSTAIGGYPKGAKVDSTIVVGAQWYSLVDSNTTDPDDPLTSTNWARVGIPAGTPLPFFTSSLPDGFVPMNDATIGSATSGATNRANADTLFAYASVWANFPNAQIQTSGGVVTTRGANPVADFLANKRLVVPSTRGMGFRGVDGMGNGSTTNLSGVPVTSGNTTTPGSVVGANLQGLVTANMPVTIPAGIITNGGITISHNANFNNGSSTTGGGSFGNITVGGLATISASQATSTFSGTSFGSNTAHNNTSNDMLVYWGMKL